MKKTIISLFALVFIYSCTPQDAPNTFRDSRDGKVYKTVTIGEQVWMAENLAYLPDDPGVVGPAIGSETEPHFYVYGYYGTNVAAAKATTDYITYGVLYNWPAAMNGAASSNANPSSVQGICPEGWHLPSDNEWKQLEMYLGMSKETADGFGWRGTDECGKLKEAGTTHWEDPNKGATNESGFAALPGGCRRANGTFNYIGFYGELWNSTENNSDEAWYRYLPYDYSNVLRSYANKDYGFSVRCVRD
ncbi:MAG: fibrobacter succinogenes major paralogous domain-containing protein [Bacteroidales bacterium]|nr:fibrobacter succinogenes major paralogous domain-containing protein [Bacteroidales bacterium]